MKQHAQLINAKPAIRDNGGLGRRQHVQTERLLKEYPIPRNHRSIHLRRGYSNTGSSGITYTSIREGIYAEAFPVFIDWQPDSTRLLLPTDGEVAYTFRADLGEAPARIMIRGGCENQIVLFTSQETIHARQVINIINEITNRQVELQVVSREEHVQQDSTSKSKEHLETIGTIWDDIVDGAVSTIV